MKYLEAAVCLLAAAAIVTGLIRDELRYRRQARPFQRRLDQASRPHPTDEEHRP